MPAKKMKIDGVELHETEVLTSEFAAIVGKSPQWIRQLTGEGHLHTAARGRYILGAAVQEYIAYASGTSTKGASLVDEKTEHERLKREKTNLEIMKLKRELLPAAEVEQVVGDMIQTAKSKLQTLPQKLAVSLENEPAAVIEKTLNREINAILMELSKYEAPPG